MIFMAAKSQYDEGTTFYQGAVVVNAGYGFPNLFKSVLKLSDGFGGTTKTTGWGPASLGFEYGVGEKIGIGVQLGISSVKQTDDGGGGYTSETKLNSFSALARLNYHFGNSEKFDPYVGAGIGYNNFKFTFKDNDGDPSNDDVVSLPVPVAITGALGARYYFSPGVGIYAEAGYVAGAVLQAGVVFKLR
jgi:outer membrane protein W